MTNYIVRDQMFVVPVNTVVTLPPVEVKLHGSRLVEVESGHLTLEPIFLKPGVVFGMEGELPRAIAAFLDTVEPSEKGSRKQTKRQTEE